MVIPIKSKQNESTLTSHFVLSSNAYAIRLMYNLEPEERMENRKYYTTEQHTTTAKREHSHYLFYLLCAACHWLIAFSACVLVSISLLLRTPNLHTISPLTLTGEKKEGKKEDSQCLETVFTFSFHLMFT